MCTTGWQSALGTILEALTLQPGALAVADLYTGCLLHVAATTAVTAAAATQPACNQYSAFSPCERCL